MIARISKAAGVGGCAVALVLAAFVSRADAAKTAATPHPFQTDLIGLLDHVEKQILSLEDAVPQDKFKWRPAPGVRSISEAYMHIAFANYNLTKLATGKEIPADLGIDANREKWDTKTTDKAEIKKILEKSFEHVRAAVKAVPDSDLDKKVNFFGNEMTERAVLMVVFGHCQEHLGQSVAYARANNIVPPWSKTER